MATPVPAICGVDLNSVCGGRGICGRCQIDVAEGRFAKHGVTSAADHVTPWSDVEQRYAAMRGPLGAGRRLGCQARIPGDLVVDVPAESQVHRQVVRKRAEAHPIVVDPVVRLCYVEVREPDMDDPSSDLRRLQTALTEQWGVGETAADLGVLRDLQKTLRAGDWKATVALRKGRDIVGVAPGFRQRALGVALDIGSTTIAAHLCDLASGEVVASAGRMNSQIRFGEDLMSRVSYAMMNPDGAAQLTQSVRAAVDSLIGEVADEASAARADILEITMVGNPIMHHLFLGLDPSELGGAPFALALDGAFEARACELGLAAAPGAFVYCLPCIAGHVGADAAGVVLAEGPHLRDELTLLVDVGTNAELVFGNRRRLLACSSPTGPAFEGAQISCGQRAAPGAVERVRIDRRTLEPRFKVIGSELWSDEAGFAESIAGIGVTGICGSGVIEIIAEMFLCGILTEDGVIDGALAQKTPRVEAVGRTFAYLLHEGRAAPANLPDRRARHSTRQGRALRGRETAAGALWRGGARTGDAGRRFRQPYRCDLCDDARPDPRLRPDQGRGGRQCGRRRRADRPAQSGRAKRNRGGRAPRRKDRNRDRAALPGPFRRRDGAAQQDRRLPQSGAGDRTAGARERGGRARTPTAPAGPGLGGKPRANRADPVTGRPIHD